MNGLNLFKSRFLKSSRHRPKGSPDANPLPSNPHRFKRTEKNVCPSISINKSPDKENERVSSPSRKRSISNSGPNSTTFSSIEEEEDPLQFLQVKSAAQWKALSQRIQWIDEPDRKDSSSDYLSGSPSKKQCNNVKPEKPPLPPPSGKTIRTPSCPTISYSSYTTRLSHSSHHPEGFTPTKVSALRLVCWRIKPWGAKQSTRGGRRLFSSQFAIQWNVDCDEVYPSLFIGDKNSASHHGFLKKLGISHVLNTAEGDEEGLVNLSQGYYEGQSITYKGFPLWDCPNCNILPYLGPAADFIKSAIDSGGKILVNCQMGVSRSATCALAYLMIHEGMSATQALSDFRLHRDVRPNDGFLEILAGLDNELRKERDFGAERTLVLAHQDSILPTCQHIEFWTDLSEVTEEDVGGRLVSLFEDGTRKKPWSSMTSVSSSSPRRWSRSISGRSSFRNSRAVSRNSSLYDKNSNNARRTPSICITPPERAPYLADTEDNGEGGDDWEWVWEFEKPESSPLTTRKLEKVKDIIEKPEDRWRILWDKKNMEIPSPIGSSLSSTRLNKNLIQPKAVESEVLNSLLIQVDSAKKWKSISQKLSINFDDINISECPEEKGLSSYSLVQEEERPVTPTDFNPTLAKQLRIICWKIKPWDQPKERNMFTSVMGTGWGVDCDEIYPRIFLGDEASARNLGFLKKIKVTHVLNAAEGPWTDHSFVDLNKAYYEGTGIVYQGFELWDHPGVNIERYFGPANEFITSCIDGGGRILIHCQMGVSRSCVCAMSYLMLTKEFSAVETLKIFRSRRDVHPNDHFLSQVAHLDNELRKEREYRIPSRVKIFSLRDVPHFPKPFHYEFWDNLPSEESLPFTMKWKNSDGKNLNKENAPEANLLKPLITTKTPSKEPSTASSSEWEYYTETEEDE